MDPLAQIIERLRPRAVFAKGIRGAGAWAVRYAPFGQPGFCAVIEGQCRLAVAGEAPVVLREGDFVLLPATPAFTLSSLEPATPRPIDPHAHLASSAGDEDDLHHGDPKGPVNIRLRGGYFLFDTPDTALLVSLLPAMIHIHGDDRLAALVRLFGEEAAGHKPGQAFALTRLVELLLVEALRAAQDRDPPPGLLRGLADLRIARALRAMHGRPEHPWTVVEIGKAAGLSRSAFFDRFTRTVGLRPMAYLQVWRMALAQHLLRHEGLGLDEVARRVGYGSASTFSTAFSRHFGQPPGRFARRAARTA